jgi:acyl-CoA synthetase (AMP-forming)/AMP-acid ligase II
MSETKVDIDDVRVKPSYFGWALAGCVALYINYTSTVNHFDQAVQEIKNILIVHDEKFKTYDLSQLAFKENNEKIWTRITTLEAILPRSIELENRRK